VCKPVGADLSRLAGCSNATNAQTRSMREIDKMGEMRKVPAIVGSFEIVRNGASLEVGFEKDCGWGASAAILRNAPMRSAVVT
jgi:hypothetical protein